jgi:hypothetical protein
MAMSKKTGIALSANDQSILGKIDFSKMIIDTLS